jgi:hypothetical protein
LAVIYNFLDASKEAAHPSALGFRGPNAHSLSIRIPNYNKLDSF